MLFYNHAKIKIVSDELPQEETLILHVTMLSQFLIEITTAIIYY